MSLIKMAIVAYRDLADRMAEELAYVSYEAISELDAWWIDLKFWHRCDPLQKIRGMAYVSDWEAGKKAGEVA